MKDDLFNYVIREFAETIDESLVPQTTISSLGLKLAVKMHPYFKELFIDQNAALDNQLFANMLVEFLFSEFGYEAEIKSLNTERIRFAAK